MTSLTTLNYLDYILQSIPIYSVTIKNEEKTHSPNIVKSQLSTN